PFIAQSTLADLNQGSSWRAKRLVRRHLTSDSHPVSSVLLQLLLRAIEANPFCP
ncbi:hypothetical protein COCVIDRAFT_86073, partial [Bipolaris victoriae FI3]